MLEQILEAKISVEAPSSGAMHNMLQSALHSVQHFMNLNYPGAGALAMHALALWQVPCYLPMNPSLSSTSTCSIPTRVPGY